MDQQQIQKTGILKHMLEQDKEYKYLISELGPSFDKNELSAALMNVCFPEYDKFADELKVNYIKYKLFFQLVFLQFLYRFGGSFNFKNKKGDIIILDKAGAGTKAGESSWSKMYSAGFVFSDAAKHINCYLLLFPLTETEYLTKAKYDIFNSTNSGDLKPFSQQEIKLHQVLDTIKGKQKNIDGLCIKDITRKKIEEIFNN